MHRPDAGQEISHYRLVETIGRGGMGEVWLAEDLQLPRKVAIKLIAPHLAEDEKAIERLVREAQATASIDHPAVAAVFEAGDWGGRPYLVMQHFEGETLRERLDQGTMSPSEALALAAAVADALAEVHALGIVHRDLKPSNIMLTGRGPKILDFGLAGAQASPRLTAHGDLVGTPSTMSPEQIQNSPPDNRSDLWALGVILYQALTGELPFTGNSYQALFKQILEHQPARPSEFRSGVDPDLDYIVIKLLRKNPAHRYSRAEDLLADIASLQTRFEGSEADAFETTEKIQAPPDHITRLAVVPFEIMSPDPDDGYLAGGLVEDLIVDLTRVEQLHVASRGDVESYADRKVPPRTIARELDADYVLMGSVRRLGNRARISAQLVRANDGHTLWAERFDRTLEDLFGVQEEVSNQIVTALQVALRPDEREMLQRAPTNNTEAYTMYLRARELMGGTRETNLRAERLLNDALDLDPDFALAHAALGETYAKRGWWWWAGLEMVDLAMRHIDRALELEPGLTDALRAKVIVKRLGGSPDEVLAAIDAVLASNPDDEEALEAAAMSYLALGRADEALPILERLTGRYSSLSYLHNCYDMLGRTEDSERAARMLHDACVKRIQNNPEATHERSLLATQLVGEGRIDEGTVQAERAVAIDPKDGRVRYNAACTYAAANMLDKAIEHLTAAVGNLPSYVAEWPKKDPDMIPLRDHPEYIRLIWKHETPRYDN